MEKQIIGRAAILAGLLATAALASLSAHAGCVDPRQLPAGMSQIHMAPPADTSKMQGKAAGKNIVGTWFVSYMSGGNSAGQAYIQWHSDGTEWENINMPIENGNICLGSWKKVDGQHVSRNHYGWLYTSGTLTGYFNESETAAVQSNGTYTGVTDIKIYNLAGELQVEIPGTSSAVLVAP
ncbi:MAG TPA: hypothetical protein VH328_13195 [Burkholderiaceae bacterium]|jgi:hypothetical protein|nr:hypothetical protein [Burkholderiaceae bacterium]